VPARPKLDVPGAITVTGGLLALVFGIIERNIVAGVVGIALLVAFWLIELRAPAPLAPVRILTRATVKWGNYAGLIIFSMETAMIFLLTLYLQRVLALDPLATGLIFGIPGLASVWAGVVAGRFLGRFGYRAVLVTALALQGLTAIPLIFLGDEPQALVVLVPVLFVNFFVHVTAIVAFTVTSTSGLLDHDQGLATGLTTMTQNIGITVGIPVLSAIAATQATELAGIHLGIAVGAVVVVGSSALVWAGLRPRRQRAVDERILSQVDSAP
jgi:predicted MFS family arabinose efflux permease